jgi:hypothetical protein
VALLFLERIEPQSLMRDGAATDAGFGDGRLKFDVSEEAAPEVFASALSPHAKRRARYLSYHGLIVEA